jgi:glycosyltransferase involved in cell wall biosynthesis
MRVLFLAHNFPRYSGDPVGSFILRLAVSLKTHGIDVHVVAPAAKNAPQEEVIEGITVSRYHYAPRRLETLAYTGTMGTQVRRFWGARLAMLGLVISGYRAAMRVAARTKIDVVHAHWWFPGGLVARAIRARKGIPYVVTMHGSDIRLGGTAPGGAALFKAVAAQASAMTTVSTWLAAQARELDPATAPVVAPMPVAPDLFHPGDGRVADRLLFIGKLTPQKGLEYLLRALPRMKSRPTVDVVGAGRVDDAHLRDLAAQLGVADRVTWHPLLTQAELAVLYRTAAIHVIPAIEEGLGLTAVEALLSETPVVAFDSGGIPDIVVDGQTGLLVPPGDTVGLAVAVDRLLADSEYRLRLGREGRRFALTHFGPDAVARQYATLLTDAARRT